eukprot:16150506-Heterocapsa_arctica.AAC.1
MNPISIIIDINLRRDDIYEFYKYELREPDEALAGGLCVCSALAMRASRKREFGITVTRWRQRSSRSVSESGVATCSAHDRRARDDRLILAPELLPAGEGGYVE